MPPAINAPITPKPTPMAMRIRIHRPLRGLINCRSHFGQFFLPYIDAKADMFQLINQ